MRERDIDDGITPIPETSETTSEESAQEARQKTALQELFLILEADAKKGNKPVNAAIRAVPMLITSVNESMLYVLRINPAIVSDGRLNVAVLDLYRDEASHIQQWVVKAEWIDGKPEITGLDESMVEDGATQFRLTEIAEHAGRMLSGKIGKADTVGTAQNFTMQMPPEYAPRIN